MKTLQDYNDEYLDMQKKSGVTPKNDFDVLMAYVKNSSITYHGDYIRTALLPKIFRQEDMDVFSSDINILYGIFKKIVKEYFENPEYRREFGFDKRSEDLILGSRYDRPFLPMARIDFFYNEETGEYKFCEFNTDGTSAMSEDRELNNGQLLTSTYENFMEKNNGRTMELFDTWVETVARLYSIVRKTDEPPYVVITDYLESGYLADFEYFLERFREADIEASICDVRSLKYDGTALYDDKGRKIDVIYRRAVTSDVIKHYDESQALIRAQKDDKVLLLGDFHTQIIHNKKIFTMFFSPSTRALLSKEEADYLDRHVPYTGLFDTSRIDEIKNNKDGWILKPIDSYASKGIYAGIEYTQSRWESIVDGIPKEGYIMQEFCMPYVTKNYGELKDDADFGLNRYYNLTGVYVYDGVATGILSRISLTPIISTQYSEKSLPTIIVS